MTRNKAIHDHCYDCAGSNTNEVTLCPVFDCPLWRYRTGTDITSKRYLTRITKAFKNLDGSFRDLESVGIFRQKYLPSGYKLSGEPRAKKVSPTKGEGRGTP